MPRLEPKPETKFILAKDLQVGMTIIVSEHHKFEVRYVLHQSDMISALGISTSLSRGVREVMADYMNGIKLEVIPVPKDYQANIPMPNQSR